MLNTDIFFNKLNREAVRKYELQVNKTWQIGNPTLLEFFYKNIEAQINPFLLSGLNSSISHSFFWFKVTRKYKKQHSGLPQLITNRMKDLVNTGFDIVIKKENGEIDEEKLIILDEILEENKFRDILFDQAIVNESWSGYTVFKFTSDSDISDKPVIENIESNQIEIFTKRGRIVKYVINFIDSELFVGDTKEYFVEEIYEFKNKIPRISYKAYAKSEKKTEITQSKYEDTGLKKLGFLPIFFKKNTSTNTVSSTYGTSDYTNSISLFDDLDEKWSQFAQRTRMSGPKRFIDERLLQSNENGETLNLNDFEIDYVKTKETLEENEKTLSIDLQSDKPEADEFIKGIDKLESTILANAGLSPITIGNASSIGLQNSGETVKEKEKLSIRTRDSKLKLWKPFLEDMFNKLLQFNDFIVNNGKDIEENNINVIFDKLEEVSFKEQVSILGEAVTLGLITRTDAIGKLNPTLSNKEINDKLKIIKSDLDLDIFESELLLEEENE